MNFLVYKAIEEGFLYPSINRLTMVYYQIEQLWDKKGGFEFDIDGYITGIKLSVTRPYWSIIGVANDGGRIYDREQAIMRAKRVTETNEREEAHVPDVTYENWDTGSGRKVHKRYHPTAFRVVEVSPEGRRVIWLDERPAVRKMIIDMRL